MAARTVVCPECSETLPYGRLSCPACGSLLASVAGGPVRIAPATPPVAVTAPKPPEPVEEAARPRRRWRAKPNGEPAADESQAAVVAANAPGPARPASPAPLAPSGRAPRLAPSKVGAVTLAARLDATVPDTAAPTPPVIGDWPAPAMQAGTDGLGGPSPWRRDGVQRPRGRGREDDPDRSRSGAAQGHDGANGNGAEGKPAPLPAWAGGPPGSTGTPDWPAAAASVASVGAKASTPPPPGAWLPPSGAFTARDSGLARGQLVHSGSARVSIAPAPAAGGAVAAATNRPAGDPDPQSRAGDAPLLADLPFESPNSLPGWLIAAGSAAALAGFLLPWSTAIPFASGFGYLDTWGLATPSHLLVLLLTVGVLALAILPNRIPPWLRTGVAGLVLGGLLVGIIWPYLLDGFGAMIGALAEAAAAMLLIVGGLLAVRPERHAEDEPAV